MKVYLKDGQILIKAQYGDQVILLVYIEFILLVQYRINSFVDEYSKIKSAPRYAPK